MSDDAQTRTCKRCGCTFPLAAEYFRKSSSGLRAICIYCSRAQDQEYRKKHADRIRETKGRWQKNNPEKVRASKLRYRKAHPGREYKAVSKEKRNEKMRIFRASHKEGVRESNRIYRELHKAQRAVNAHAYRARKRNAPGSYTVEDIVKLYDIQKGLCWWCGKKLRNGKYHIDHRVPLARGGTNNISNIVLTHAKCNLSKGSKMPDEFIGRLL